MAPTIGRDQIPAIDMRHAAAQTSSTILSNRPNPWLAAIIDLGLGFSGEAIIVNQTLTLIADNSRHAEK